MAKKPETKFRESTYPDLNALPKTWWESIQQKSIRGTPDVIGCTNGYFWAIEYKIDDGDTEPLQSYKHKKIKQAGGRVFVAKPKNWKKVIKVLRQWAETPF